MGVAVLPVCGDFQKRRQHSATTANRALTVESGQAWACQGALQGQMQPLLCAAGVVVPALGAAAGLCSLLVGGAVLPVCGEFKRRSDDSATAAHRALPVCGCQVLGMPWGITRSNEILAVFHKVKLVFCYTQCYTVQSQ